MKYSNYFVPTRKENPSDCVYESQSLMYRSGMLSKVSNGLFVYHPTFLRTLEKIKKIIEKEMESVNSVQVKFPILVSKEILDESGRWDAFGNEMFKLKDRNDKDMAISPTNEEAACALAKTYVESYRDLPFSIYQIQQKHRDEICPRGGVMRAREFMMKDAYSFHTSFEDLDKYYLDMRDAYLRTFKQMGLDVVAVLADTGAMGGNGSQEIMAVAEKGEAEIALCSACGYGANLETVPCFEPEIKEFTKLEPETVYTPKMKTIEDVASFFNTGKENFAKSIFYTTEKGFVVAMCRGDREINEIKLKKYLGVETLELSNKEDVEKEVNTIVGFVGPVGLNARVVADYEIKGMSNFIVGANKRDYHTKNVNNCDFTAEYADIRFAVDGDICPVCKKPLKAKMGNELGHIFKLGTRYTEKMNITYKDAEQKSQVMIMGCYGIGLERTAAAIVDQHHDENGIVWPKAVAPFAVDIVTVDMTSESQVGASEKIYNALETAGVEVIWDDRKERAGFKFKDADLVGYPIRVTVGKKIDSGIVEIKDRKTGEVKEVLLDDCALEIAKMLK